MHFAFNTRIFCLSVGICGSSDSYFCDGGCKEGVGSRAEPVAVRILIVGMLGKTVVMVSAVCEL